jgi:hypothetical protein
VRVPPILISQRDHLWDDPALTVRWEELDADIAPATRGKSVSRCVL